MPSSSIRQFNLLCLALCAMFFVGTVLQWRATNVYAQEPAPIVEPTPVEIVRLPDGVEEVSFKEEVVESEPVELKQDPVVEKTEEVKEEEKKDDELPSQNPLPKEINLPVPFTSQAPEANWDQPWQDACEEAAVLMLDAYYKEYGLSPLFVKDEILKMVAWEEEKKWGNSIEIEKVKQLTEWYAGKQVTMNNQQITIIENPTIEDMKQSVASGHPVLVVANGRTLPNPNFRNGGPLYHALVIRGYTEDSFITNDPGTRNGKNFVYAYDDLMNAIRDWNNGDVKSGRRAVLVIR